MATEDSDGLAAEQDPDAVAAQQLATQQDVDAVNGLKRLVRKGFRGIKQHGDRGRANTLQYRRRWKGVVDVVVVYGVDDAEAYRTDDVFCDAEDVLDLACRSDLMEETQGWVADVVSAVLRWPEPDSWFSHFPSASAPGRAPGQAGVENAPN